MSFELAKEKAIKYMGISKKSEQEVREKLKKCNCEIEIIDKVILYLIDIGYIDDYDYVDAYIRQCMHLLNYSIYEIKHKLLQKGIKKCIIEEKLESLKNTDYENELIKKLLKTKCKAMDELKQKQYLFRRGLGNKLSCEEF